MSAVLLRSWKSWRWAAQVLTGLGAQAPGSAAPSGVALPFGVLSVGQRAVGDEAGWAEKCSSCLFTEASRSSHVFSFVLWT